ncbi:glycosyltransferase [Wenzhouxiangella sp. XN24]|uniref:glycosyltransferase n=1 Tax=Wenzhouxiangella sp. XN24 TaxID=2713569 RepID=UPI0013EDE0F3|nr:glycosyltransferase [Wenzhouxiangella sp. XN24]
MPDRLTVIVPVSERHDDLRTLHDDYRKALLTVEQDLEFIYVLDGPKPQALQQLRELRSRGEELIILQFGKWFGEAAAISAGFSASSGTWVMTLPSYYQVEPASIADLWSSRKTSHMTVACRHPRAGSAWNRVLGRVFNALVRAITGTQLSDLGCGARLMSRNVLEEIPIYGDQHRFLPVLASMRGFSVTEVPLAQSPRDLVHRPYGPGVFLRRILDLVSVFFLARFTKKPLRFFGLIGTAIALVGALWTSWLVVQRVFMDQGLGDRPALILAALLITLGVQVFTLGLVGEIIIFTHARDIREYAVEEVT